MMLNNREKINLYRLSFDGQVNAALNNKFPYYTFEFKENIDGNKLSSAVIKALDYHPSFKTKIVKIRRKYYLVENEKLPIVKEANWNESVVYGGDETNNYPWIITFCNNRVIFTCAHAICDGTGAVSLLRDVFNIYFGFKVEVPDDISKRFEDSFNANARRDAKEPFKRKKLDEPYKIPLSFYESDAQKCEFYQFIFKKKTIADIYHNNDTSMAALLSGMVAKALSKALNIDNGIINIMMPVNLRMMYGSITDTGFVLTPKLAYQVAKLKNRSIDLTATAIRSQLDLFIDKDNLDYQITQADRNNKLLNIAPFILKLAKKEFQKMLYSPSASIVYTHLGDLAFSQELSDKLETFYVAGPKSASPLIVVMGSCFKDEITLTLGEFSKNNLLSQEFENILIEENIEYKKQIVDTHAIIEHKAKDSRTKKNQVV